MFDYKVFTPDSDLDAIGGAVDFAGRNMEQLIEDYEKLLIKAYIKYNKLTTWDESNPPFGPMLEWLRTTDFYTAPASTRYHDSHPGGLLVHSIKVYNEALDLMKLSKFQTVSWESMTIAALVHDWCKIGYYESYQRNVKNEETGKWEKQTDYRVNQKGVPLGHGATSLYLVMRIMRVDTDVALAIRQHMGAWSVCDTEKSELQLANSHYPIVYLIQFADQLACVEY